MRDPAEFCSLALALCWPWEPWLTSLWHMKPRRRDNSSGFDSFQKAKDDLKDFQASSDRTPGRRSHGFAHPLFPWRCSLPDVGLKSEKKGEYISQAGFGRP